MAAVQGAPVKHTDGTTWLKAGAVLALWTITSTAATAFKIVADGSRATLAPLYGALRGNFGADRCLGLLDQQDPTLAGLAGEQRDRTHLDRSQRVARTRSLERCR